MVAGTVGCRKDVGSVVLRYGGIEFEDTWSKVTWGLHPTPPFNPGVGTPASQEEVTFPEGLVDTQHPAVPNAHDDDAFYLFLPKQQIDR